MKCFKRVNSLLSVFFLFFVFSHSKRSFYLKIYLWNASESKLTGFQLGFRMLSTPVSKHRIFFLLCFHQFLSFLFAFFSATFCCSRMHSFSCCKVVVNVAYVSTTCSAMYHSTIAQTKTTIGNKVEFSIASHYAISINSSDGNEMHTRQNKRRHVM